MKREHLKILAPLAVLGGGALLAVILVLTRPAVSVQAPEPPRPLVRVLEVAPESLQLTVRTHGTVTPRNESDVVPEVAGSVVWVSPSLVSGGVFEAGELLLRIERTEYEVAVEQARAALARAVSEHRRAERTLERQRGLAERNIASPAELDEAQSAEEVTAAMRRQARAALRKAELDLDRTELHAPYAGRVREESVDVGQFVSRGARVAKIYAIDFAEVRLPVPDDQLAYVQLPGLGLGFDPAADQMPQVTLRARFAGSDQVWEGRVVRTEGQIDARSRMVYVVARVEDPYRRRDEGAGSPLAVGLFVEAEIFGKTVPAAIVLPRSALRDGDRVWVVDADDRLRFRPVEVLRASGDQVVVTAGLAAGERVCVSTLQTVVDGMSVRALTGIDTPVEVEP